MFDIFFISFNELNQEKNWQRVVDLHPSAIRLHGIKGIDKVHLLCNDISKTDWFWTIDGDNFLFDKLSWDVNSMPNVDLFLFNAIDPIQKTNTNLGGVKLWRKGSIINPNMDKGDFCLNATKSKRVINQSFSVTEYNSSPYEAWKTSFRHCVKLKSKILENRKFAKNIDLYLSQWEDCKHLNDGTNNADWAYRGFQDAVDYVETNIEYTALLMINDYDWLRQYFKEKYMDSTEINLSEIDYSFATSLIPFVMNALYNKPALESTNLEEIRDAFRVKQLQGKSYLLNKIKEHVDVKSKILVIGSWFGFTSYCLYKLGFQSITEVDPDSRLEPFTRHLNRFNKSFKHITDDINNVDTSKYDVVINTSCEHILDNTWFENISTNSLIFLQSTNLPNWDHVNIANNTVEMISKYPMDILENSVLDFKDYQRFTIIGKKYAQ